MRKILAALALTLLLATPASAASPTAPTLSVQAGDGAAELTWTASTDSDGDLHGYQPYVGSTYQTTLTPPSRPRTWTKTGLTNGTSYSFRIIAIDAAGNYTASNTVNVTPQALTARGSLLLSDDFTQADGTDPDSTKWSRYNGSGHGGIGLRRPAQCKVYSSALRIRTEIISGVPNNCGMSSFIDRLYGRWQADVRVEPNNNGSSTSGVLILWPQAGGGPWPTEGELDFWETGVCSNPLTCDQTYRNPFYSFLHWEDGVTGSDQTVITHPANATEWHKMTIDWYLNGSGQREIKVYRDGILTGTLTGSQVPDGNMHLAMQLDELGSDTSYNPVNMWVDNVRIWAP